MILFTKQRLTDLENRLMVVGGKDSLGVWDGHVHTAIFKMANQKGPTIQCGNLDGSGFWDRMDTCIYIAESLHCSPETITTLLIDYTPIQNKKLKKKKMWYTYTIEYYSV